MDRELATVLERIAAKLDDARHGYEPGDLDAEQAFSAAISTIQQAILDVLRELEREHRASSSAPT